jgi:hypothetical protein
MFVVANKPAGPQILTEIISVFGLLLQSSPEFLNRGGLTGDGRIEYYRAFGGVTMLFMKIQQGTQTGAEREARLAQVMAECEGICSTSPASCWLTFLPFPRRSTLADRVDG